MVAGLWAAVRRADVFTTSPRRPGERQAGRRVVLARLNRVAGM